MYKSSCSPSSYEKIVGQAGLFNVGMATDLREGKNSEFKPVKSRLKN